MMPGAGDGVLARMSAKAGVCFLVSRVDIRSALRALTEIGRNGVCTLKRDLDFGAVERGRTVSAWMRKAGPPHALGVVFLSVPMAHAATPQMRGFEVYRQVCSTCHSLDHVRYQDLRELGISVDEIRQYAAGRQIADGLDDDGDPKTRAARPDDLIGSPYPTPAMGRLANHGDLPPDFSRIALTHPGGAAWIERMLQSFGPVPGAPKPPAGAYPNSAMRRQFILMPPPLHENGVHFADGTPATVPQMAHDVAAFLDAVAHPHQPVRRHVGWGVLAYLAVMAGLVFALKRRVWR